AVLPVGVEEKRIELTVEVVVVRDIASRPRARIELQKPTVKIANEPLRPGKKRRPAIPLLAQDESQHTGDRALFDHNAAVHVGLAEFHLRIEENPTLGGVAPEANGNRLSGTISERETCSACGGDPKRSCTN